jgi:hypothetical protein
MKNLKLKNFALAVFCVFAFWFVVLASLSNGALTSMWNVLTISYRTIPLVLLVIVFFINFAWHWPIFRRWLVPFPNLNGTWQGKIQTTWRNPETGETPGPIPVILSIKQSFIHISCVMRTSEMTSRSFLASFWLDGDEQIRKLGFSYHSVPLPTVVDRSQPHDGTVVFEIIGEPVRKINGVYWTSRKTTGEMNFEFREKKRLEEFPSDLGAHPVSEKP